MEKIQLNWVDTNVEKPKNGRKVYVLIENDKGKIFQSLAYYFGYRVVLGDELMEEFDEDSIDYDAKCDKYWVKEGFYEYTYTAESWLQIHDKVVKWHPIFDLNNCKTTVKQIKTMELKEYHNQILIIENDYNLKRTELSLAFEKQKKELLTKYFDSNLKYKVGDIVSDGDISILVDTIELHGEFFNGKPTAYYCGRVLKKDETAKKRGGGIRHIESAKAI